MSTTVLVTGACGMIGSAIEQEGGIPAWNGVGYGF